MTTKNPKRYEIMYELVEQVALQDRCANPTCQDPKVYNLGISKHLLSTAYTNTLLAIQRYSCARVSCFNTRHFECLCCDIVDISKQVSVFFCGQCFKEESKNYPEGKNIYNITT